MSLTLALKTSALCVVLGTLCSVPTNPQETFDSPANALKALVAAVKSDNSALFLSVAGTQMAGFWNSGEPQRDLIERDRLLDSARIFHVRADQHAAGRKIVYVGDNAYRFPAPLVYTGSRWRFDGKAGAAEIAARRIVRNETAILELSQQLREAEFAYRQDAGSADGAFALRLRSTPGKHDGLFWSSAGEEDESPLGPPFAAAAFSERRGGEEARPLHGYYVRLLSCNAPEGEGRESGFGVIAWPAEYGVDGLHCFILNHRGDVYQKDWGRNTAVLTERIQQFNPDSTWTRISRDK